MPSSLGEPEGGTRSLEAKNRFCSFPPPACLDAACSASPGNARSICRGVILVGMIKVDSNSGEEEDSEFQTLGYEAVRNKAKQRSWCSR